MSESLPPETQDVINPQPGSVPTGSLSPLQNVSPANVSPKKPFFKISLILLVAVIAVGAVGAFVFLKPKASSTPEKTEEKIVAKQLEPASIEKHNKALVGYYAGGLTEEQINEITIGREKVIKYAQDNNITVTDEEVLKRKDFLITQSGTKEKALAGVSAYGWSEQDWESILWWQILREKVMDKFEAYREGEVISVRWDSVSSEPEKEAPQRSPVAKAYMEDVKKKLTDGGIKNLKQHADTIKTREITLENKTFVFQYTGLDKEGKYFRFSIDSAQASAEYLTKTKFPEITEVTCTLRGCLLYNIISGSNGSSENSDIKDFLNGKLLI